MTYRARPGDVYLLCSDGLTTMVREEQDRGDARASSEHARRGRRTGWSREANDAGGRDNITVVAFRLEDAEGARVADERRHPGRPGGRGGGADRGPGSSRSRAGAPEARTRPAALGEAARGAPAAQPAAAEPRKVLAAVLVTVGLGGRWPSGACGRSTSSAPTPAAAWPSTAGLPYTCRSDIKLYSEVYAAPVQVSSIPANRRDSATTTRCASTATPSSLLQDLQSAAERARQEQAAGSGQQAAERGSSSRRRQAGRSQGRRRQKRRAGRRAAVGGGGSGGAGAAAGGSTHEGGGAVSARNRELLALIPVALLVTAGFTAVFIVESSQIGDISLIYGGYFLAVCLGVHIFIRAPAAVRGPVPVPALRAAGRDRPGDAVPDQRLPGPQAGVDLRRRRRPARADDPPLSRLPRRSSATAT